MVAFGPVLGFLLGAYMLSHHVDSFSGIPLPDDAGKTPMTLYGGPLRATAGLWSLFYQVAAAARG